MIEYKFEEELEFAKYYAAKLNDEIASRILTSGSVNNADEARHLSQFFWKMVDASVNDEKDHIEQPWIGRSEFFTEKLMYSLSGYLERAGYEEEWDKVSDQQDL